MTDCGCCITEDDLVIVCPKHYYEILSDSNVRWPLVVDAKTAKIYGITIVPTEKNEKK